MRMRKKKNLEVQLEKSADYLIIGVPDNPRFDAKDEQEHLLDFENIFGNNNPVVLEIGAGKGKFACDFAKINPNINILAVEKSSNVIVEGCKRAKSENVPNVRFFRVGAEYLHRFLPPHSFADIYLNFSCPCPKKDDEIHRLTNPFFLEIYKKLLHENGEIHQKTDDRKFFEYSLEAFSANGFILKNISLDLHADNPPENIITEYEEKFVSQGLPIYSLSAVSNS